MTWNVKSTNNKFNIRIHTKPPQTSEQLPQSQTHSINTQQLSEQRVAEVCKDALDKMAQPSEALNQVGQRLLVESIEVIKEEVNKKKWKEVYEEDFQLAGV